MIKFIMVDIKDISIIYDIRKKIDNEFIPGIEVTCTEYKACNYYDEILNRCKKLDKIKDYKYKGCYPRIAKEHYEVYIDECKYEIVFTLDTFENHIKLTIEINSLNDKNEYDLKLESLKIELKNELLKQWNKCLWVQDKQSEELSIQLYTTLHNVENKMRELVNSVLIEYVGIDWIELEEFGHIKHNIYRPKVDFERIASNFKNIDSSLISMSTQELYDVMKMKIYKNTLKNDLSERVSSKLKEIIITCSEENENIKKQKNKIKIDEIYDIKINLWDDVFKNLFDETLEPKKIISDFIKNRNHIAHNKLVDNLTFKKINKESEILNNLFDSAIDKLNQLLISQEQEQTLEIELEQEYREKEGIRDIQASEAGVNIRWENEIVDYFNHILRDMYEDIYDKYYFYQNMEFSQMIYSNDCDKNELFTITNKLNTSDNVTVYRIYNVDEGQGAESYILLEVYKGETNILNFEISYTNGEVSFNSEQMTYMPECADEIDFSELNRFKDEFIEFINEDINSLKKAIDDIKYRVIRDGGELPVYNIPCEECGEEYISKDENICKIGKCINCGEENEISICMRCYSEYINNGSELCEFCMEKIERE